MINDTVISQASVLANQRLAEQLQQIGQLYQQAVMIAQKKAPPPQMPPDVQASIQIAKMDTDRKSAIDQATFKLKEQSAAADASRQQSEAALAASREEFNRAIESMNQRVELMKNAQDNHQHQITELLKNNQDNQTAIIIERLKQMGLIAAQPQADVSETIAPLLEAVQTNLNDQLAGFSQRLDSVHAAVTKPRRKPTGGIPE